jgi:IclR family pca regulon transcriptional regulator
MRDPKKIQSVVRGLGILELFGKDSPSQTLTEIAAKIGLNKTTTQRFLYTLVWLGYLKRQEDKKYILAPKVISLGFSFLSSCNLLEKAESYLLKLSSYLNKTVNLAILDDIDTLFIYRKEVKIFLKFDLPPGSKLPAYAGSLGKVLLAGLNDEALKERIGRMKFYSITPKTISSQKALWQDILKTRKRGYGICDQELSMDLYSVAVPLINKDGEVVAAINVSMEHKYKFKQHLKLIIKELIKAGQSISSILGYEGQYPRFRK